MKCFVLFIIIVLCAIIASGEHHKTMTFKSPLTTSDSIDTESVRMDDDTSSESLISSSSSSSSSSSESKASDHMMETIDIMNEGHESKALDESNDITSNQDTNTMEEDSYISETDSDANIDTSNKANVSSEESNESTSDDYDDSSSTSLQQETHVSLYSDSEDGTQDSQHTKYDEHNDMDTNVDNKSSQSDNNNMDSNGSDTKDTKDVTSYESESDNIDATDIDIDNAYESDVDMNDDIEDMDDNEESDDLHDNDGVLTDDDIASQSYSAESQDVSQPRYVPLEVDNDETELNHISNKNGAKLMTVAIVSCLIVIIAVMFIFWCFFNRFIPYNGYRQKMNLIAVDDEDDFGEENMFGHEIDETYDEECGLAVVIEQSEGNQESDIFEIV